MKRIDKLRKKIEENKCYPYLISNLKNVCYLTGFDGSSAKIIVFDNKAYFITDSRYAEYAQNLLDDSFTFILQTKSFSEEIKALLDKENAKNLYLEEAGLSFEEYCSLKQNFTEYKLLPSGSLINELRMIKEKKEIEIIKHACSITDQCAEYLQNFIHEGISEWEIATEIGLFHRQHGCLKNAFDAIVASGTGSSMPHYMTANKKLEEGDPVLIDMGGLYQGYNSDLTRTFFVSKMTEQLLEIYKIVQDAQQLALETVKPGMTTGDLDALARDFITAAGYGEYFGHSLGHGVGIDIHELPTVRNNGDIVLQENMIITIEPGIYLPNIGGVRIEDTVLITKNSGEALFKCSKEPIVL